MPGEVERVETLLIQVCADCDKPVPQAGGHIHKRFSPTRQIEVVRVSDLDAIRYQERQRVRELLLERLSRASDEGGEDSGAIPFGLAEEAVDAALDSLEEK